MTEPAPATPPVADSGGPSLLRIERWNYGIGAIVVAIGALTQPPTIALGLAVGVLITCLNFFVLRKLVVRWTSDAAAGRQRNAQILMLPKMAGLMGLVAVSILFLPIDAIAFVIGFSVFMISIVAEVIYGAIRPAPAGTNATPTSTETSEHNDG